MGRVKFTEAEGEALTAAVREAIESVILTLQTIGLSREGALDCLIIQSVIRMADNPKSRRLQAALDEGIND